MKTRLQRAMRLTLLAKERVDVAKGQLANARRSVIEAVAEVDRCEGAWGKAALAPVVVLTAVTALEQQSANLRTLRLRVDAAARRVTEAKASERLADEALVAAVTHHRKLELWSERLASAEQEVLMLTEARDADALAARTVRQRT